MAEKEKINALFARNLRALMNNSTVRKGKTTQRELASYLGITPQAVSTYCNGIAMPDYSLLLKIAAFFGVSTDYLLTGVRPENKEAHELLGLSDEAIELLKELHSDKEIEEKLLPFVNALMSDKSFYLTFWKAVSTLITECEYFITRFANAGGITLNSIEREHPEIVAGGLDFATSHAYHIMADFFSSFFREHTDITKAETLYKKIKPRLLDEGAIRLQHQQ